MASSVDICNMALAYLGDRATLSSINPPEGSAQADHCARFYPIAVREILRAFPWTFATKRVKLPLLATLPTGVKYAYNAPSDMVAVQRIVDENELPLVRYSLEQYKGVLIIVTETPLQHLIYTSSDTPPELFSAGFAEALAHLLASKLAGPVITGSSGAEMARNELQLYQLFLKQARTDDALQILDKPGVRNPFVGDFEVTPEAEYGSY